MRVVGHVLRARYRFLQRFDQATLAPFWAALSSETREVMQAGPLETHWYPVEIFYEVIETVDRVLGQDDGALIEQMGAYAAEINVTGPFRGLIFKFGNPGFGLRWTPRAWAAQFDGGQMRNVNVSSNSAEMCLSDIPGGVRPSMISGVKGWLLKAVELFGAQVQSYEIRRDEPTTGDVTFWCEWR